MLMIHPMIHPTYIFVLHHSHRNFLDNRIEFDRDSHQLFEDLDNITLTLNY